MTTKKDRIYYSIISIVIFLFLLLPGEGFYSLYKDSAAYLNYAKRVGVMPFYQIFLQGNRLLFGESAFLYAAAIEQTLFAAVCCVVFFHFLREYYAVKRVEALPLLIAILTPLTINLPISMVNREILTEAFSYPLFYIFMIFVIRAVSEKTNRMFIKVCIFSCLMAMVRTQMQLTFVIAAAVWFYIRWRRCDGKKISYKLTKAFVTVCQCAGIFLALILILLSINEVGQTVISLTSSEGIAEETAEERAAEENYKNSGNAGDEQDTGNEEDNEKTENEGKRENNVTVQYGSLLIDKTLYEMDYEDYRLFEEEELQRFYLAVFEQMEMERNRYVYAREGLWKWQDIMNGIAGGTDILNAEIREYRAAYPDCGLDYEKAVNQICMELLRVHWPRILYHFLCLIPVGTLCTVFFQIEEIYLACHIFAFGAYFGAALLMIIWYRRRNEAPRYWEGMMACIAVNWIWILTMCMLFFGMQRYMIYGFGPFWSMVYILALKLLQCRIRQRRQGYVRKARKVG